jgi:D-lactate dehydrogenase (cytochrome)
MNALDRAALGPLATELEALLGERLSANPGVRALHGRDESYHAPHPPDLVAFPESTAEVAAIVRACARRRVPVIPFGIGSSLEGHVAALHGGVCIDTSRMHRVLEVNAADMDVRVQPGITRKDLNAHLRDSGLFFPIDPGANASIGGMASTRASGTMAVRYGTMRDNVLALEVVLPEGEVVRTGTRARKSSAGYDLTRLFVGAEGTLGVITEVTLRLFGQPEAVSAAVCPFPAMAAAVESVIQTIQLGVPVARIEFLDEVMLRGVNLYSKTGYAEMPTLFYEFHGSAAAVAEQAERAGEVAREHGATGFQWAARPEDRSKLWTARDNTLYGGLALRPGAKALITDVCVPISQLAECILRAKASIQASGFTAPIVGHVGDGNFHTLILVDPEDRGELARAAQLNDTLVRHAQALGGTCTGEHGIGSGKIDFLRAEAGAAVDVMKRIKAALDPIGIMNPGKIFR